MGLFEHWPYTNFHELNLDWICRFVKKVRDRLDLIDKAVEDAQDARDKSEQYSLESEAWAVGTKNGEPVDADAPQHENNSKYWAEQAAGSAGDAKDYADDAKDYADDAQGYANDAAASAADTTQADAAKAWAEQSEAWAVGTKNGVPVGSDEAQYENNSKYYAQEAAGAASAAVTAALATVNAEITDIKNKAWKNFFGVVIETCTVHKAKYNGSGNVPGLCQFYITNYPDTAGTESWGEMEYRPGLWDMVAVRPEMDISQNLVLYPYHYNIGTYDGKRIFGVRVWDLDTNDWALDGTTVSQFVAYFGNFTHYNYNVHGGHEVPIPV